MSEAQKTEMWLFFGSADSSLSNLIGRTVIKAMSAYAYQISSSQCLVSTPH